MTIKIPERNYLTFSELQVRWQCSENDLRYVIICGELKPSMRLIGVHKTVTWDLDAFDDWVVSDSEPENIGCSTKFDALGWKFLQDPVQTAPFDCEFLLVSDERDADKGELTFAIWRKLNGTLNIENIKESAVFLLEEVARYEAKYGNESEYSKPAEPLATKERTSYLNIIGVMLMQLTAGKANNTSVITRAVDDYGAKQGISERKLQDVFAKAKRSLDAT